MRFNLWCAYLRELDDYHAAVNRLHDELLPLVRKASATELGPGFIGYLEQMHDLGQRLQRLFSMMNENALRILCKSATDVRDEFQEVVELEWGSVAP